MTSGNAVDGCLSSAWIVRRLAHRASLGIVFRLGRGRAGGAMMLRSAVTVLLSGLVFVSALCAAGPRADSGSIWSVAQASSRATIYLLRPNDRLRIKVYNEPEISGEYQVDASGFISIPLAGRIRAGGLTADRLERLIVSRLTDGVIRDPKVSVEVATYAPFYILGEVKRPAELPYRPGLLVLDAIAAAGGYTYRANERKVFIRRAGSLVEEVHSMDAPIAVFPGDNIRVPERYF